MIPRGYQWHPAIEATEMRDGAKLRIDTLGDGQRGVETILKQAERHDRESIRRSS